jgi:hypothetical protein
MAIRLILIIIFVLSCVFLIRKFRTIREQKAKRSNGLKIHACADCGVYVAESEAVRRSGRVYCSDGHAKSHEI